MFKNDHLAGHSMGADGGMSQVEQLQEIRDRISDLGRLALNMEWRI